VESPAVGRIDHVVLAVADVDATCDVDARDPDGNLVEVSNYG